MKSAETHVTGTIVKTSGIELKGCPFNGTWEPLSVIVATSSATEEVTKEVTDNNRSTISLLSKLTYNTLYSCTHW